MEYIRFEFAALIDTEDFNLMSHSLKDRTYSYWLCDGTIVTEQGTKIETAEQTSYHDIVPLLYFSVRDEKSNLIHHSNIWKIGEIFMINDLLFQIINNFAAVCLSSIGKQPFVVSNKVTSYISSDIRMVIEDWFNFYIQDITLTADDIIIPF